MAEGKNRIAGILIAIGQIKCHRRTVFASQHRRLRYSFFDGSIYLNRD
jgi:hypothetical protein